MVKTRRTGVLWFVFLAVPGSGLLRFDGLPFSSKIEFSVFVISLIALFSSKFRHRCQILLSWRNGQSSQWLNTILLAAIALKFFTFVLAPIGNGFESCYRSVYAPPKQEVKCEKSFEAPFLFTSDTHNLNGITRLEKTLDFGSARSGGSSINASETTWRLPFVNEYPRFEQPWLDRPAFTAKFAAFVDAKKDSFIPVQYVGEVSVLVDDVLTTAVSYERSSLLLVPIVKGTKQVIIEFKFADLDVSEIPDRQPPIRGPWAELFVGKPITKNNLLDKLNLNIQGWSINQATKQAPDKFELRNQSGETVADVRPSSRPDVAQAFSGSIYTFSGLDFVNVDISSTGRGNYFEIYAKYLDQTSIRIGRVTPIFNTSADSWDSDVELLDEPGNIASIDSAYFLIDRDETPPLQAKNQNESNLTLFALHLLDFLVFLSGIMIFTVMAIAVKNDLITILKISGLSLFINFIVTQSPFSWWGYRYALFPIALGLLIGYSIHRYKTLNLLCVLPGLVSLMVIPMIEFARNTLGLADTKWWGFQIFRVRQSDWFVTQGYARQIFVEASLNGGENLFYFQPATRYLVLIQHLLFGENDVLLAVLMGLGLSIAVVFFLHEVLKRVASPHWWFLIALLLAAFFVMFTNQIFLGFAAAPSSEFPTWILLFITFGLIVRGNISGSMATVATVMAALTAQFRPNQAFGALFIFLLVQCELAAKENSRQVLLRIRLALVFAATMSLSLVHNLYYGFGWVFFSVTGGLNSNFSYSDLLNIFNDANVRTMMFDKLSLTLNLGWPATDLSLIFWMLNLIWVVSVIRIILLRNVDFKIWIVLIFPFTYFIPQIPYDILSYYPRHVVATQLAFALSGLYVMSRQGRVMSPSNEPNDIGNLDSLPDRTDTFQSSEI